MSGRRLTLSRDVNSEYQIFALGNDEFWKQFKAIFQHRMRERLISFFLARETLDEELGAWIVIFEAQLLVTQHHARPGKDGWQSCILH